MIRLIERRLEPADSPAAIAASTLVAIFCALAISGLLFIPFGANPIDAYGSLLREAFGSLRGFGQSLVQATPLILIAQGMIVIWRAGLGYIGFEGCFLVGAAAAAWAALGGPTGGLFWPAALIAAFAAGAVWAGAVGALRVRFGGNEVLISLMANYVAALLVQYLVSGPMRAPGDQPQTPRLPMDTWLGYILPGSRAHAGIFIALAASAAVWILIRATPTGYALIVSGLNPRAARYGGIHVGFHQMLAMALGGGLAGLAGLCNVLGVQHRLMDGLGGGVGFVGIVVALLARLSPLAVVPTAILYGGLEVGGSAMQRESGLPTSVVLILQSLIVLLILTADMMRYYRLALPGRPSKDPLPRKIEAET